MKTLKLFLICLLALPFFVSCNNGDKPKFWLEPVSEEWVPVADYEGTVEYHSDLGKYVLRRTDVTSICGMIYVPVEQSELLKEYQGKYIKFSGCSQLNRLVSDEAESSVFVSTEYYLLDLDKIELLD